MTTLNLQVSASSDDAFENAVGTVTTNGTTMVFNNAGYWIGYRFTNVTIPQGATINMATLSYYVTSTTRDDNEQDVYGNDVDDAATFTTAASNISSRTLTTAKTTVSADSVGVGFYAVDVTAIVQEIIDRAGWASGNDLALLMDALTGVNLAPDTYDNVAANAAKLDIDYSAGLSATVNQVSETDTAQAITHLKTLATGQNSETDTAQPVARLKTLAVAQVSESDTAQAITARKTAVIGQATETDLAQAITVSTATAIGQASETDTAQPVTARKTLAVGQANETDVAQPITRVKLLVIGIVTETDSSQVITARKLKAIGQASETDTALAITAVSGSVVVGAVVVLSDAALWLVVLGNSALYSVVLGDSALYGITLQNNER